MPPGPDRLDRVRQQPEQRGAEQRAGREADQVRQHGGRARSGSSRNSDAASALSKPPSR